MNLPRGIGKLDRERITAVLRGTQHTISIKEAVIILGMPREGVAKLLSRWAMKGWLMRIKRGVYVSVPLESSNSEISLEDPWIIAEKLYNPCYIGGWSAAEHWGLTEQIFRTLLVLTTQKPKIHNQDLKGTHFLLRTVPQKFMFGLQFVWRGQIKVQVSDPSRTVLDLLVDPKLGGGIRTTIDIFKNYLKSEYVNFELLFDYIKHMHRGAVFKRLGFLLEQYVPAETKIISLCKKNLTTGNVKLDPQLSSDKLVTRWRLWLPTNWEK